MKEDMMPTIKPVSDLRNYSEVIKLLSKLSEAEDSVKRSEDWKSLEQLKTALDI